MHLSGVILCNDSGEILLLHRATARRTQWEIPGGKIEEGEEPAVAAKREALEELAGEVTIVRELGSDYFHEDGHDMLYTWFLGSAEARLEIGEPDKYDDLRYWSLSDLKATRETISANTRNFVRHALAGKVEL